MFNRADFLQASGITMFPPSMMNFLAAKTVPAQRLTSRVARPKRAAQERGR